jgi:hypothetical protein
MHHCRSVVREPAIQEWSKLLQRPAIYPTLEEYYLACRVPVVDPFPVVELGPFAGVDLNVVLIAKQTQQKPSLFLPDTHRAGPASDIPPREAIAKPVTRLSDEFDMDW